MKFFKNISFFPLFYILCTVTQGQTLERYNSFTYNVNEGLLQSGVNDLAFDKNNFCWLSFANGIQKFDGNVFTTITTQAGLPDDKWVNFFSCRNGDLLISHLQGISKYDIKTNRFTQFYNNSNILTRPAQFIGEDENIIYTLAKTGVITGFHCQTLKIIYEWKTDFHNLNANNENTPTLGQDIVDHKAAIFFNKSLYLWDLKAGKMLYRSAPIPYSSGYILKLKSGNEVYFSYAKENTKLMLYNFTTNEISGLQEIMHDNKLVFRGNIYHWNNKMLFSGFNKLFETDSSLKTIKSELVNFKNESIAGNATIAKIKEDNFGNLYLVTVNMGIRKIMRNNYKFKYYGTSKSEDNFVVSILPDKKNNRILAGTTGGGLLVFDTLQRLVKHIKKLPGSNLSFIPTVIVKNNSNRYLLFNWGEKKVWQVNNDFTSFQSFQLYSQAPGSIGIGYFGKPLFQNKLRSVVQSQGKVYITNLMNNQVTEEQISGVATMSGLLYNGNIVTHSKDELVIIDTTDFKELKRIPFGNTGDVRCFAKFNEEHIYLGTNKGIFKIDSDGKILLHLNKDKGLPDECIYAMVFDDEGYLWCSTNKGVFKLNSDNSTLQLKKEDGLQENEFNTNVGAKADDGEIFFGGVNGVSSFYASAISDFKEKINLLITRIKINNEEAFTDTAVWDIAKINLPYNRNSLSFDFVAMANNNPNQYIYQYKMEGIDEQWIQNQDLQTVRYLLPPGEYVLKIYASRFYNKDAMPMKEIRIIINPPFWKTWWFFTAVSLLFVTTLGYLINLYNKRRYQEKLLTLENEHKIQLEKERISRDLHDSIGAYANAVLYNTELLQQEADLTERDELMKDLKFASKDIITSLRETIWALKKDNYTAEDCWLRIKNFIQPFARYYPHIKFTVEGEAPAEKNLHYTKALNVVRIVQEAVTNAIKHATPANLKITSRELNGRWQLSVINDGKGFNYEAMKKSEVGNGLHNMKQRAMESDFEFGINSDEATGTRINIIV